MQAELDSTAASNNNERTAFAGLTKRLASHLASDGAIATPARFATAFAEDFKNGTDRPC